MNLFDPSQIVVLENEKVLLRPLEETDFEHLLEFSLNEPEIWRYSLLQAGGEENLKKYIQIALAAKKLGREFPFIVFDKQQNRYAGSTRFYDIQLSYQTLQLGYTWYGKDFQGTGLNKQCKFLLLEFAFEKLGMERVEFRADNNNARSIAAMKSIGCTVEGVLRSHMPDSFGGRRDSIVLSILKKEWENGVRDKLKSKLS
ncbi:GNAT family N-acetyltransferase [Solitalea canadensis]|uniref:Acetyltransferase, ribosomal protein N-acetylase n=1 Tax=Solitalea canadensis (strain ATCC 29591 / DSM 3403 / JCM 21819 / LMG 8368 / NBRC 15130 / NCIMB 12057 / USAM 9D) TaxID=929556 RepID=H8KN41_SOLCM|nr:GNAT family protein [Solitalea canadensis]AFD09374.1 acetyltransferase, ribosomal protein N-acetylase [Solitalea canadensis DSM 3403]